MPSPSIPGFCDLAGRDFHLDVESPCAPDHSPPGCGLTPLRPGGGRIGFTLPRAARVRLDAFDAAGRHLRTLAEGSYAAGRHTVAWEEPRRGGPALPAGVVFLRLTAGGGQEAVEKVVVLR